MSDPTAGVVDTYKCSPRDGQSHSVLTREADIRSILKIAMNETAINTFNAIAFPPVQPAGHAPGDPFFAQENDPVTSAIAREFGRIALGLTVALIVVVDLIASAVQTPVPAARPRVQVPAVTSATAPASR